MASLALVGVGWLTGPARAAVDDGGPAREVRAIEVWTRGPAGDPEPAARKRIPLASFEAKTIERVDPQYQRKLTFRGVPLASVIERAAPAAALDLAILRFANGMVVPLPFRDAAVMKRLDAWLVREVLVDGKPAALPPVERKNAQLLDVPVMSFEGNKLSVAEAWHPMVPPAALEQGFSPWLHTDSLVAIELAKAKPYYAQFDVGAGDDAKAGFGLFKESCQFCHGVRKVGARFGWDFVEPMPLARWRGSGKRLYWHVAFRRYDAQEKSIMMPALKHMTEADAAKVFAWLEALATKPLLPYRP